MLAAALCPVLLSAGASSASAQTISFEAATSVVVGHGPAGVAVGDFNHDSDPDLAVANSIADTVVAHAKVFLRAERSGSGDGRVYRIAFTASDGKGGSCDGHANVAVPHDRKRTAVDSAPPSYNSFGP